MPKPVRKTDNVLSVREALQCIYDKAVHTLGTEADIPLDVARENARTIKRLAKNALAKLSYASSVR